MGKNKKQVNKAAYRFDSYMHLPRWNSLYWQVHEVLAVSPNSVLEIGKGTGLLGYVLNREEIEYDTLDIAEDLKPDIVGDVTNIPSANNAYDVVVAFQVLEHIPYDQFEKSFEEMVRVAKKYVVISLPHYGPNFRLFLKVPLLRIQLAFKVPYYRRHSFDGEHYWEIGKRGYSPKQIRRVLEKYGNIERDFIPFENPYHHFFVLKKH